MELNNALHISKCEKSLIYPEKSIDFYSEDTYTLIHIAYGKGKLFSNNTSVSIQTNSVVCIRPQQKAKILTLDEQMQLTYFQYSGGEADYLYQLSMFKETGVISTSRSKEIFWCFENIYTEFMREQISRYYLVAEILHIFSHYTQRVPIIESRKYHNRYLMRAIDIIQMNPSMPISVNVLAEKVNIDRSYLYRIFKKETLLSPREYMIDYKLRQSVEQLQNKNENIQAIFEKLGFSSYYLAEKKFKEKYGMTPREYQKQEGFKGKNGTSKNH